MKRLAGLLVLLLAGCAAPQPRAPDLTTPDAAYRERAALLGSLSDWSFTGRLGLRQGDEGGSGRLDWVQRSAASDLRFRGALGAGAWRLQVKSDAARLVLADGTERVSHDVVSLVQESTGWRLPVDALGWWVLGLAAPEEMPVQVLELSEDGLPQSFQQAGWQLSYERYSDDQPAPLPTRLLARRDDVTVRLAISRWQISEER